MRKYIITVLVVLASYSVEAQRTYKALEFSFIALNTLDAATTIYGVNRGAVEANPLMNNTFSLVAIKMVSTIGYLWLNRIFRKQNPKAAMISLIIANAFYTGIVANNLTVVIRI